MEFGIEFWILAFILASIASAYIFRKFFKAQNFFIISVIKTEKFLPLLEKLKKFPFLERIGSIGVILGFGAIAVDYLYGKKLSKAKRILLFALSFAVLYGIFSFLFYGFIEGNPITQGYLGIFSSAFALFGFAGFLIAALGVQAIDIIVKMSLGEKALPGVAPVIPGVQIPNVPIFIPIHGWISLLLILVVHEGFHGIMARRHDFKIKSTGLLLFGFLPIGAFVEPDEKELEKAEKKKAFQVYAIGPTSNLMQFGVVLGIFLLFSAFVIAPLAKTNVVIVDVTQEPALGVLEKGSVILELNGEKISSIAQVSEIASQNQSILFKVRLSSGEIEEHLIEKNSQGSIGISSIESLNAESIPFSLILIAEFLFWLFILSFLVGTVNFLPMEPFDGGRIAKPMIASYFSSSFTNQKEIERKVGRFFVWLVLGLLLINALPLLQF